MKTSAPRTLVHAMNTHLQRWKKQVKKVEESINSLPPPNDLTVELEEDCDQSKTESDHSK